MKIHNKALRPLQVWTDSSYVSVKDTCQKKRDNLLDFLNGSEYLFFEVLHPGRLTWTLTLFQEAIVRVYVSFRECMSKI